MHVQKPNLIVDLSIAFSLKIILFANVLKKQHQFNLANQLFRSGTSIGANVMEAQEAESRADFIHKMKLAAKEANETYYWIILCKKSEILPFRSDIMEEIIVIKKIINRIIISSKNRNTQ